MRSLAPNIIVAIVFVIPVGIAAGAFFAVDWALMTDIVPKATSGRYMEISTVVAGPPDRSRSRSACLDGLGRRVRLALGPRAALLFALVYSALGALLLRPVDERRRE